jgi:hypothetical protein
MCYAENLDVMRDLQKVSPAFYFTAVFISDLTWSLTLREEHRLRAFENKVLRGIFEPKEG